MNSLNSDNPFGAPTACGAARPRVSRVTMGDGEIDRAVMDARAADGVRLPRADSAARLGPTPGQAAVVIAGFAVLIWAVATRPGATGAGIVLALQAAFVVCAAWRVLLVVMSRDAGKAVPEPAAWPRYTILAALHDEADVTPQLIERLAAIDYPADRLEGFLVLEAHDRRTIDAALRTPRPDWLKVLIAPPGTPRTKPRALNIALARCTGEFLTVYDAEDDPDPLQLREAAARFAADRDGQLACLQAPLRIRRRGRDGAAPFLDRQFAVEYAALFEVTLPAMARMGLPFPLGGTSNHFRVEALKAVGGWDAFNVTEDADLGFRLWRHGRRLGVISRPTYEPPPGPMLHWLPQRTRWLKGFMQTWGVNTRRPWRLGLRGALALTMTIGVALVSAVAHGPSIAWVVTALITAIDARITPATPLLSMSVMVLGAAAAWLSGLIGARRAGVGYSVTDMLSAPAYWSLLSLAFAHAAWRLVVEPFAWDKTSHAPDPKA
ncbi:MAG: glycosyltransferase family 2 protein [Brevundimonas sp.]